MGFRGERTDMTPRLYTPKEAGELLGGVSEQTVRRMVEAGQLRIVNVGTDPAYPRMRIREDDLMAFIEARTQEAPASTTGAA